MGAFIHACVSKPPFYGTLKVVDFDREGLRGAIEGAIGAKAM